MRNVLKEFVNESGTIGTAIESKVRFEVSDGWIEFRDVFCGNIREIGENQVEFCLGEMKKEIGLNKVNIAWIVEKLINVFAGDLKGFLGNIRKKEGVVLVLFLKFVNKRNSETTGTSTNVSNYWMRNIFFLDVFFGVVNDIFGLDSRNKDILVNVEVETTKFGGMGLVLGGSVIHFVFSILYIVFRMRN